MSLPTFTKKPIVQGDTIPSYTFTFGDGYTGDLSTATDISLRLFSGNTLEYEANLSSGITVNSSTQFTVDEVSAADNDFTVGELVGDLSVTEADGTKTTYFRVVYTTLKQY